MSRTAARGYGSEHQRLRKALLPQAVGSACTRCGQIIQSGQQLDLDHTDDRTGYLGFAHASCNRRAAAIKKNNMQRRGRVDPTAGRSRDW